MLTAYIPVALAVAGTILMAVVIFAPVPVPASVTVSFAPPAAPRDSPFTETWPGVTPFEPAGDARIAIGDDPPRWPALVDPSAADCDAATRLALVEALRSVRAPWADEILRRALDDERDETVREAIGSV
jgi:hypothetical protein